MQTNLGRMRIAHDLAYATAVKMRVDILVVGEPNKKLSENVQWIKDKRTDVAIMILNKKIRVAEVDCGEGYIRIDIQKCQLYCCYISPNIRIEDYKATVDIIMQDAGVRASEKIILGDINAKSPLWGSPQEDKRGEYWCEWLATLNMGVLNDGKKPTFIRGQSKSYIDVTCSTNKIQKEIRKWEVLDDETLTEHQYITFEISSNGPKKLIFTKYKTHCDWATFKEIVNLRTESGKQDLETIMKEAYHASTTKNERPSQPFWWNEEIKMKRDECQRLRRQATRAARRISRNENEDYTNYKRLKKELQALITKSKNKHWGDLCQELDSDIWGKGYKIATKKLIGYAPLEMSTDQKIRAAEKLFPKKSKNREKRTATGNVKIFTGEEYTEVLRKMKNGKAPGLDGVPMEAIKKLDEIGPTMLLNLMNELLKQQKYPRQWKKARLVLIPKGKIEDMNFRPICLLNSLSKIYEGLLKKRLEDEIEQRGGFSERQYGFRKGKSTIQAIEKVISIVKEHTVDTWAALITIDVKNAFNNASWDIILNKLDHMGMPEYLLNTIDNYLEDRSIQIDKGVDMAISAGVPQGSILGPTLWNVLYNGLLDEEMPKGVYTLAYADDVAVVATARNKIQLKWKVDEALTQINKWMTKNELELAPHKTEAVILRGRKDRETITFTCNGIKIQAKDNIEYLGINMGQSCQFGAHVKKTVAKAEAKIAQLMRITPNLRGPESKKREMLYNVVKSILVYGAPIWYKTAKKTLYKNILTRVQRKMLIRVASAYRTVSARAVQVITGTIPIELIIEETKNLYHRKDGNTETAKREEREKTIHKWQEIWNQTEDVAQWTKKLIPRIGDWLKCSHRKTDYYLSQILTGHGSFTAYTKRIGKTDTDQCRYCNSIDTPAHTLLVCPRWQPERDQVNAAVGTVLSTENTITLMLHDRNYWKTIHIYIKEIMKTKENEERQELERNKNRQ